MHIKRPTSVSVIGWFFIVIGTLSITSGGLAFLVSISQDIPQQQGFGIVLTAQVLIAAVAVYAGVRFLKGSRSMRYVLEAIAWLLLAAIVLFYMKMAPNFMSEPIAIALVVLNFITFAGPFAMTIYFLRGVKVRKYLECNKAM